MNTTTSTPDRQLVGATRRTLLVAMIASTLVAVFAAGCGDRTTEDPGGPGTTGPAPSELPLNRPAPIEHPTGADDAVIRLGYEGGLLSAGTGFADQPLLIVAGDGKVYRTGPTTLQYPGPLLTPITVTTITAAGVQTLLAAADEAGLLGPPPDYSPNDSSESTIADAPDTVVTIEAGGGTYRHGAYALGMATETSPARAALLGFVLLLQDLTTAVGPGQLGDEVLSAASEYRLRATPTTEAELAGIEPAPDVVDWPVSTGLDLVAAAGCARLTAAAAGTLLADATSNTVFRQGDALYRISAAAVLPGDPVC